MASTATASKTAPRSAAARRAAARRRAATQAVPTRRAAAPPARRSRGATPIPGRLVPLAVGRTAGAVGGIADSGLVVRLTRGRLWIAALAVLLIGIVALNVAALSFTASGSQTARTVEELNRESSALRAQLTEKLSSERVQGTAAHLGLIVPEPGSIRYLRPSAGDAAEAARRLRSGELAMVPATVPVAADPGLPGAAAPAAPAEPAGEPAAEPVAEAPAATGEPVPVPVGTIPAGGEPSGTGGGASGGGVPSP